MQILVPSLARTPAFRARTREGKSSQRSMVAAKLETLKHGDNQHTAGDANLHVLTRTAAAGMLNVSPRSGGSLRRTVKHSRG